MVLNDCGGTQVFTPSILSGYSMKMGSNPKLRGQFWAIVTRTFLLSSFIYRFRGSEGPQQPLSVTICASLVPGTTRRTVYVPQSFDLQWVQTLRHRRR